MDKLIYSGEGVRAKLRFFSRSPRARAESGEPTISNDGATIMKLLDIVHPAAQTLVDIARSQDEARAGACSLLFFSIALPVGSWRRHYECGGAGGRAAPAEQGVCGGARAAQHHCARLPHGVRAGQGQD